MIIFVPHGEGTRILLEKRGHNKYIWLSSLYNPVPTPTPNPGTGSSGTASKTMVMEKNFVGRSRVNKKTPVPTPTPNPGTGARTTSSIMSQITERNFAGHKETETLPSSSNITQHKVTDIAVGLAYWLLIEDKQQCCKF
ncbi:hypothetical protein RDI58_016879 [Solanum bulbocastanum]|uniref:Uncharacterized protein n=1 Tax=Solanum bulbocastanum TaxID=147425 RepID=A0AAN8TIB7_SOLBU